MAVYIASFAVYHQVNPGWAEWNYAFAFPRATGEFLIGVWIYTAHWHARRPSVWLLVPTGGLSLLLFATGNSTITFVNSITLVPLTIALASSARVPPLGRGLCKWLGDMSYPIYVLHYPLYALAFGLLPIDQLQPVVQVVCITLAVVPIAYAGNALDMRVRRWLGEKMTPLAVARPPAL
jgi:peptidoglycan/LPS O-acetylase OafA/YrhL